MYRQPMHGVQHGNNLVRVDVTRSSISWLIRLDMRRRRQVLKSGRWSLVIGRGSLVIGVSPPGQRPGD